MLREGKGSSGREWLGRLYLDRGAGWGHFRTEGREDEQRSLGDCEQVGEL